VNIAFVGLGNMGYPMAGHLVRAGFDVTVFNRTTAKAQRWHEQHGGRVAGTPADAASGADVVCVCVGNDDDVREVTSGARGVFETMRPGSVLVDHSTASASLAREVGERAAQVGVGFVDAPVSGGQSGAEAGRLSVMCGGEAADIAIVGPVFEAYAASVTHLGPIGCGQLTKMVNQVLCAAAIEGAAEALNMALAVGLDPDQVLRAVTGGAANSWYLANRGATMMRDEFDFGFAVDWMRKDLRICLEEAARRHIPLPLTAMAERDYANSQARGDGRLDASAIIRLRRHETARAEH
jgi:3-hydroxyisobutyrate dehydrogenase